jgi:CNT family concentrative nucleoside transporter
VSWWNLVSVGGYASLCALAWLGGGCRRPIPVRTLAGSSALLAVLAALVFWIPPTRGALLWINDAIVAALAGANAGAEFLFGPLAVPPGGATAGGEPSIGFVLAAQVLPAVVFFAALMGAAYHLGLIQPLVRLCAHVFRGFLGLSGAEALSGAANVFFGVESAAAVRPYLERMTRSELLTCLTCGMSTVASTTLAVYVLFLKDTFPLIAGHLVSASVLAIPAAAMTSKLILPETGRPETLGRLPDADRERPYGNAMSALAGGAWDGLRLAAGIAALLIAVLGIVALADMALAKLTAPAADALEGPLSFRRLLGWVLTPLALVVGIEWGDAAEAGRLLGERIVLTEVVAYRELGSLAASGSVSPRTLLVMSYALCGFAHVASVGVFVGGFAALAPARRDDLAALGPRALLAATLATLLTGALAGAFFHGQRGVLGL